MRQDAAQEWNADPQLRAWVRERRAAWPADGAGQPPPGQDGRAEEAPWGLAFSGGGIRSATFCLGLASGLASKRLFHRFDLLSTVSGGGYIGAALGKLYTATQAGPHEVEERLGDMGDTWFVWWLRATSRYLTPRGTNDLLTGLTAYLRNMFAVHLELGLLLMVLGAALGLFNLFAWQAIYTMFAHHPERLPTLGLLFHPGLSTLWLLAVVPLLACVPLMAAYWSVPARREPRQVWREAFVAVLLFLLAGAAGFVAAHPEFLGEQRDGSLRLFSGVACLLALLAAPAPLLALAAGRRPKASGGQEEAADLQPHPASAAKGAWTDYIAAFARTTIDTGRSAEQRNVLTKWLSWCVAGVAVLLLLGLVDRLAWFVAFERRHYTYVLPVVLAIALGVARSLAAQLPTQNAATAVSGRILFRVAEGAGLLLFLLVAVFWVALVYRVAVINLFAPFPVGDLLWSDTRRVLVILLLLPLAYIVVTAGKREFANLSSLHMFYRARLTRSYLGAANGERFRVGKAEAARASDPLARVRVQDLTEVANRRTVYQVDPGDGITLDAYAPHRSGGPVHILNVTVNQTWDPLGGLFNQDRKGQYLSVTTGGRYRVDGYPWDIDSSFGAAQLPAWMAISGAAFAPGLGGQTSRGLAVLLFMAGVRLGFWWEKKPGPKYAPLKYQLLLREAFARFGGTDDAFWYLSDGGHFENTGAYTLLRERVPLIVVADAAADPRYEFEDLENLVRKARIDLQAEIEFMDIRPRATGEGGAPPAEPDPLRFLGSLQQLGDPDSDTCIAPARITYADASTGWLLYVKPNMFGSLPLDLINFKRDNPAFPQEPTTDQFFSEAQWESYFRLGRELGRQVDGDVLQQLLAGALASRVVRAESQPGEPAAAGGDAAKGGDKRPFTARFPRAASLAKSGLSLTALAAALATGSQIWDKFSETRRSRQDAYVAEIGAISVLHERLAGGDAKGTLPELTAKFALLARRDCRDGDREIAADTQTAGMFFDVAARCARRAEVGDDAAMTPACNLLQDAKVRACLAGGERLGQPVYWAVDYTDPQWARGRVEAAKGEGTPPEATVSAAATATATAPATATATATATAPAPAPAPAPATTGTTAAAAPPLATAPAPAVVAAAAGATKAARAPASVPEAAGPCSDRLVYLQIYGAEQRSEAEAWKTALRAEGARVPGIEDVVATAQRQGRTPPRPVAAPTAIYHTDAEQRCAAHMQDVLERVAPARKGERIVARPLARGLVGAKGVVEVWLPAPQPDSPAPGANQPAR